MAVSTHNENLVGVLQPNDLCIIANMGTLGDFKPAFLAAACLAREGGCVVVLAQPKDEAFVVQKMGTAVRFAQCEEAQLELEGECQHHTFYPPVGGPPKVVSGKELHSAVYQFKKLVYEPVLIEPRLVKDAPQLLAGGLAVGDHAVPKMLLGALSEVASFKDAFQVLVSAASFK